MQGASDYAQAQADLLRKQQQQLLDEAKKNEENRLKALESSNQQAIDQLNRNKITVNENADNLNRQEYLSRMQNQESLNNNLSRYRIGTSGARETSLNNLYALYGENVNKNNTDRNQGLRDIDNKISDTNLAYETNKSNALSEEAEKRLQLQQAIDSQVNARYSEAYGWYVQEQQRQQALREYEESMRQSERQYQLEKERLALQREQAQREYELSRYQTYNSYNNNSYGLQDTSYDVSTDYFQGNYNSDVYKYGTFDNGYQPKGISGHGTLKKSGQTIVNHTQTLSGQKRDVTQSIWVAQDGTKWYWEGRQNRYIQYK